MDNHRPDCYLCKYRRDLPGDAHSSCVHPTIGKKDPIDDALSIFASVGRIAPRIDVRAANALGVQGNPNGIRNGWFNWPCNFDPTWLISCNGFESKTPVVVAPVPDPKTEEEPKILYDFGWANGWDKTPEIVTKCRDLDHHPSTRDVGPPNRGIENVVICKICQYVYRYDCSD